MSLKNTQVKMTIQIPLSPSTNPSQMRTRPCRPTNKEDGQEVWIEEGEMSPETLSTLSKTWSETGFTSRNK
jgi:hypothetical protein